jgi:hypothetical protein
MGALPVHGHRLDAMSAKRICANWPSSVRSSL